MKYLLILFIIAVALAPLTHFLPSKRQRQQARMREHAAVEGLFVEFRDLPGSEQDPDMRRGSSQVIYYGKRLPPARGKPRSRRAWLPREEGWRGLGHREAMSETLAGLPASVLAASVDEGSCGVYWREAGEDEDAARIVQQVQAWAAELGSVTRGSREAAADDFS